MYETWTAFWVVSDPPGITKFQIVIGLLSISFVTASLLAWRYTHPAVRIYYMVAAAWLGTLSFCFLACIACWLFFGGARLAGLHPDGRILALVFFAAAILASLLAMVNAAWTRVRRVSVKLPNLPESWRGRVAALVSDTHLGPVRGLGFIRRIVKKIKGLAPDIVFIPGDLYDGTAAKIDAWAQPWSNLSPPLGTYFVSGNHEEFHDREAYFRAVESAGVRVLNNEKIDVDGLQLVGIHFRDSVNDDRFRGLLQKAQLDRNRVSILLTHAPDRVKITEEEGISLQLSGHTHGGQFFPFTWITSRIYGRFVYGLQRLGNLLVYTSYGAGTWGPPMRLGTSPEIVLIQFE